MPTQTEPLRREIAVVTGASTGIGAATARELARRGFHVLAGVRQNADADTLRATNLEPVMLDITNETEIAALVKRITGDPERHPLRALVNKAHSQQSCHQPPFRGLGYFAGLQAHADVGGITGQAAAGELPT